MAQRTKSDESSAVPNPAEGRFARVGMALADWSQRGCGLYLQPA